VSGERTITTLHKIVVAAGLFVLLVVGGLAGIITFNAPVAPPVLAAGNSIPGIETWKIGWTVGLSRAAAHEHRLYALCVISWRPNGKNHSGCMGRRRLIASVRSGVQTNELEDK
jgi:hypothetical protein